MTRTQPRPSLDLPPVFIGSAALAEGLVTPRQLRGTSVRSVLHGVYRPAWVELTHQLRCAAACLVLPPAALITGRSAATMLGLDLARPDDDVEVAIPFAVATPRLRGVRVRRATDPFGCGKAIDGVRLVDDIRLGFDLAARHPLPLATAHLDAAARAGLVNLRALGEWARVSHADDIVAVRAAVAETDPRAESLPESRTRVILRKAGFDLAIQHVIRGPNGHILRADMALVEWRIAISYDGAWHALRSQLERDRAQLRHLREVGWVVVHVTADLLAAPRQLVAAVQSAVDDRTAGR